MMHATDHPVLAVRGLVSGYGNMPVLHGIDMAVQEGEIVGILGHNGMGKSTLLKSIMGFLRARSGAVSFDGADISRLQPNQRARRGLGYIPQGRGIFPKLSVRDNLRMAWHADTGVDEADALDDVLAAFPRIERLLDRDGGALSGGEQQLLALARGIMADPWFLLLDEPTEGIQPSIIEEMEETLLRLRQERGLTILLVEQNFDFISVLSDRVLILERGKITTEFAGQDINDPRQVEEFLGFGAVRRTRGEPNGTTAPRPPTRPTSAAPQTSIERGHKRDSPAISQRLAATHAALQVIHMSIRRPSLDQMRDMATRLGMSMSDDELTDYLRVMEPYLQCYDRIDATPDYLPEVRYPRSPGYRPSATENPLNAWYYKTDIKGAVNGPLAGKRIALKDTICLAGVPMMNGSSIMEGYIPEIDATIVTRMLDAGATIAGKAVCEDLCLSGGSHTSATGPVHNPYKMGYSAGGSSSGSAALVATGEVDMSIGGDQGGSIRIPSFACGCYGMKPTHGLVPYSGIMAIEKTIDHVGPITRTVADNALLLEVLAGPDGLDPRQQEPRVERYTEAVSRGAHGLRIGVLEEGFGRSESEADVDAKVRGAADKLRDLGARVEDVSIPEHQMGPDLWTAIAVEGLQDLLMHGNATGTNDRGLYLPSLTDHFANWRGRAGELSPSLKVCMFLGEYFQTRYRGRFYGKAQNLMRRVAEAFHRAFQAYDLLVLPTLPMKAQPLPPADAPLDLYVQRAFEMVGNTSPFNASGFPAMNVPCGMSEGLPIGFMLVAQNYGESTIYRAAGAFEALGDWRAM